MIVSAHFHYSADVYMGFVICCEVWRVYFLTAGSPLAMLAGSLPCDRFVQWIEGVKGLRDRQYIVRAEVDTEDVGQQLWIEPLRNTDEATRCCVGGRAGGSGRDGGQRERFFLQRVPALD